MIQRTIRGPPNAQTGSTSNQLTPKAPYKPAPAKAGVEWHPGELYSRAGFIVTNLARPVERLVAFYNQRGTCGPYIKEGKGAVKWTRLSQSPASGWRFDGFCRKVIDSAFVLTEW
jgi:hypothetical protein